LPTKAKAMSQNAGGEKGLRRSHQRGKATAARPNNANGRRAVNALCSPHKAKEAAVTKAGRGGR